jgi:hypothetical protein
MALIYTTEEDGSDGDYGKLRRKPRPKDKQPPPQAEVGRATKHTLDESLEQMMSGSFDVSFLSGVDGEQRDFSPRMNAGFDFGDSEDFGFGDIGDELARELGEGWASVPFQSKLVLVLSSRHQENVHVVLSGLLRRQTINPPSALIRQT